MIAFIILLSCVFVVLLIDWAPQWNTWQSRIHIGRWKDRNAWTRALSAVAVKWLKKTPVVTLTDNRRLVIIDMILGRYRRSSIQHWQQAALLLGLSAEESALPEPRLKQRIIDFTSAILPSGRWKTPPKEVDAGLLAYALMESAEDIHAIKPALDEFWEVVKGRMGKDGTVCYRSHMPRFRYVDTIGFICPFLVRYGQTFNVTEAVELAVRQITSYDAAMLPGTFLPAHTYVTETGLPSGLFGWGRGMGWYAIGLADAWRAIDASHPGKALLEARMEKLAASILPLQRENGGWGWNATNPHAITDSSATAMLAWFMTCAAALPHWHDKAKTAREKAVRYLMKVTRRDGTVDFSQGDTKDIAVYSQIFDRLPFAQGFALRCAVTPIPEMRQTLNEIPG